MATLKTFVVAHILSAHTKPITETRKHNSPSLSTSQLFPKPNLSLSSANISTKRGLNWATNSVTDDRDFIVAQTRIAAGQEDGPRYGIGRELEQEKGVPSDWPEDNDKFVSRAISAAVALGFGTLAITKFLTIDHDYWHVIGKSSRNAQCGTFCLLQVEGPSGIKFSGADATISGEPFTADGAANLLAIGAQDTRRVVLGDLDPSTAKLAIGFLGPFLSAFGFLFILRIVMSWYPKLPVEKFPYVIPYAPTEPLLAQTRKLIPPVAGVDVTPVVWFGLISFLNEILIGPQGLLVLLSQQKV